MRRAILLTALALAGCAAPASPKHVFDVHERFAAHLTRRVGAGSDLPNPTGRRPGRGLRHSRRRLPPLTSSRQGA